MSIRNCIVRALELDYTQHNSLTLALHCEYRIPLLCLQTYVSYNREYIFREYDRIK